MDTIQLTEYTRATSEFMLSPPATNVVYNLDGIMRRWVAKNLSKTDGPLVPPKKVITKAQKGGSYFRMEVRPVVKTTGKFYDSATDTWTYSKPDILNTARWDWTRYHSDVSLDLAAIDENKGNPRAIVNYLNEQAKATLEGAAYDLRLAMWGNTTDAKDGVGIQDAFVSTGTYGEIDVTSTTSIDGSDVTYWQAESDATNHTAANMRDPTNASFAWLIIQSAFHTMAQRGANPTVIVTTWSVLSDALYRAAMTSAGYPIYQINDDRQFDAAYSGLRFAGVPIIADSRCPDNHMYILDERYWHWKEHPAYRFKLGPYETIKGSDMVAADFRHWFCGPICSSPYRQFRFTSVGT